MSAHAILSPSGHERWSNCVGSVALSAGLPDTSSKYANEGTAAHFLASECLTQGDDAYALVGRDILVAPDGAMWLPEGQETPHPVFRVDYDMAKHVGLYLRLVREYATLGTLFVEQALPIDHITGEDDAEGTGDAVVLLDDEIVVIDLKYGQGNEVSAEKNGQLMMYASGASEKFAAVGPFKRARMVVIQPRISHMPNEWVIEAPALEVWAHEERAKARKALDLLDAPNEDVFAALTPGEGQCRWCKVKACCPALSAHITQVVGAQFDDIPTVGAVIRSLPDTDGEALGLKMQAIDLIEDWCQAVRAEVERRLIEGQLVEGYKLVQGKHGSRAWRDEAEAETILKGMRLKSELKLDEDPIYTYKLVSPTAIEKLLKEASPKRWNRLQPLITQSDGKPSVAPVSDKRPAITPHTTADDFTDSAEGLV